MITYIWKYYYECVQRIGILLEISVVVVVLIGGPTQQMSAAWQWHVEWIFQKCQILEQKTYFWDCMISCMYFIPLIPESLNTCYKVWSVIILFVSHPLIHLLYTDHMHQSHKTWSTNHFLNWPTHSNMSSMFGDMSPTFPTKLDYNQ